MGQGTSNQKQKKLEGPGKYLFEFQAKGLGLKQPNKGKRVISKDRASSANVGSAMKEGKALASSSQYLTSKLTKRDIQLSSFPKFQFSSSNGEVWRVTLSPTEKSTRKW